ncbi:hypothetical protein QBC40DRAFT_351025 [Triangularia verruculosa]|uniref:Chitin-binding type-1 domain-containing protein n=1 Tax=Triangularia verruculosa TaxID=2587418 RepID=A0AAN6XC29_9PEZI|nr:hypothetical protein QBC40DRAFT_351025 [Triangularia verruculosa]
MTLIASSVVWSLPQSSTALKNSADGQCGGEFTCLDSSFGQCCSAHGWCGNTEEHCGSGCNPVFGLCTIPASSSARSVTQQPASCPAIQKTETVFRTNIANVTQTLNKTETVERTVLLFTTSTILQTSIDSNRFDYRPDNSDTNSHNNRFGEPCYKNRNNHCHCHPDNDRDTANHGYCNEDDHHDYGNEKEKNKDTNADTD